jgi:hypothetical protein
MSMLNKWNYQGMGDVCYGQEIVYQKAKDFLVDNVEDWGCGMGYAGYYFKTYKGLDGSLSRAVSKVTDLETYTSQADNIMLRQVLEHNWNWKAILQNAVNSFQKKLFIGIHTPFVATTHPLCVTFNGTVSTNAISMLNQNAIPDISFNMQDIMSYLVGLKVTTEEVPTAPFEYGTETIFYVTKV